jgi:hypothetical protein
LSGRPPLARFAEVCRNFGLGTAARVAISAVRGRLWPALALPGAPAYDARQREVSVLLSTAGRDADALDAIAEIVAGPEGSNWEICVCERAPVEPKMAQALARIRGTLPRIRIVTADQSVDPMTAARWTVEQATGRFIALTALGYRLEVRAIARLLGRLHDDPGIDAAVMVATGNGSHALPSPVAWEDCKLLLQRKPGYLAALPGRGLLTAPTSAEDLDAAGVATAYAAELSDSPLTIVPQKSENRKGE